MINFILYLAAMLVILYTAILYGSQALVIFSFCGVTFGILAYILLIYQYFQIKATIVVPIATAEKEQSVKVEIHTTNKGKLPILKLRYQLTWKNFLQKKKKWIRLTGSAEAGCNSIFQTKCQATAAGSYLVELKRVRIYDFLGIFYVNKKTEQSANIQVLPEMMQMNVKVGQASRHFFGDSDIYDEAQGGHDPSEIFQIREFRAGDKIQSIHWKLSAKTEELMVKENSQPLGCAVVLLADTEKLKKKGIGEVENFLQLIYSLSFHLVDQKCAHYIAWDCGKDRGIRRIRVENEEGLYLFLMEFFATDFSEDRQWIFTKKKEKQKEEQRDSLRENYREKYKTQTYVTDIRVDGELEIFVNNISMGRMKKENLATECERLELVV